MSTTSFNPSYLSSFEQKVKAARSPQLDYVAGAKSIIEQQSQADSYPVSAGSEFSLYWTKGLNPTENMVPYYPLAAGPPTPGIGVTAVESILKFGEAPSFGSAAHRQQKEMVSEHNM